MFLNTIRESLDKKRPFFTLSEKKYKQNPKLSELNFIRTTKCEFEFPKEFNFAI